VADGLAVHDLLERHPERVAQHHHLGWPGQGLRLHRVLQALTARELEHPGELFLRPAGAVPQPDGALADL
jgi:hypothetical protein